MSSYTQPATIDLISGRAFLHETHAYIEGVDLETAPRVRIPRGARVVLFGRPPEGPDYIATTALRSALKWMAGHPGSTLTILDVARLH